MTDLRKAAEMAWVAIQLAKENHGMNLTFGNPPIDAWEYHQVSQKLEEAQEALRQALVQPEQEPVAWVDITDEGKWSVRFAVPVLSLPDGTKFYTTPPSIEAAVLAEREACAKVCDKMWHEWLDSPIENEPNKPDAEDCAKAIRARSEK